MKNIYKRIIIIFLFATVSNFLYAQNNIIFFGNSYSAERYINNANGQTFYLPSLATLVADIAEAAGNDRPNVFDASYSSAFLTGHLDSSISYIYSEIGDGQEWDYVVMQDQSVRPTQTLGNVWQHKTSAYFLYNAVRNHSTNVQPVLFQTWARESSHSYYPNTFSNPEDMQSELNYGYEQSFAYINDRTDQTPLLAPIGNAWQLANWDDLYLVDKTHMNARGRLLSALVMYSTLYNDDTFDLYQSGELNNLLGELYLTSIDGAFLTRTSDKQLSLYSPNYPEIKITELLVNASNPDSPRDEGQEFFELTTINNEIANLSGLSFIYIDGDASNAGLVDIVLDLDGLSTGSNGIFVWSDGNILWDPQANSSSTIQVGQFTNDDGNGTDMENGSATFAIVSDYSGSYNQDLDTNNDGILDATPWTNVISAVGWTENSNSTETDYATQMNGHSYSGNQLGQTPYAFVASPDGNFAFGAFDNNDDGDSNGPYIVGNSYGNAVIDSNTNIFTSEQQNSLFSLTPGEYNQCVKLNCGITEENINIPSIYIFILALIMTALGNGNINSYTKHRE